MKICRRSVDTMQAWSSALAGTIDIYCMGAAWTDGKTDRYMDVFALQLLYPSRALQ